MQLTYRIFSEFSIIEEKMIVFLIFLQDNQFIDLVYQKLLNAHSWFLEKCGDVVNLAPCISSLYIFVSCAGDLDLSSFHLMRRLTRPMTWCNILNLDNPQPILMKVYEQVNIDNGKPLNISVNSMQSFDRIWWTSWLWSVESLMLTKFGFHSTVKMHWYEQNDYVLHSVHSWTVSRLSQH